MTATAESPQPPASSRRPLLFGLLAAFALGGGGFYAGFSGLVPLGSGTSAETDTPITPVRAGSYLPIDPITINLGSRSDSRHLRLLAQLEVVRGQESEVTRLMPRIVDVLNTYLRAIDLPEIDEPSALIRLRAQMLRRIQIVVGPGRVNDLLIMEFIFN